MTMPPRPSLLSVPTGEYGQGSGWFVQWHSRPPRSVGTGDTVSIGQAEREPSNTKPSFTAGDEDPKSFCRAAAGICRILILDPRDKTLRCCWDAVGRRRKLGHRRLGCIRLSCSV